MTDLEDVHIGQFSVSATVVMKHNACSFQLTTVYGPLRCIEKPSFLQHLCAKKPADKMRWLILGDFNLIYRARDKNNRNLNQRLMRHFKGLNFYRLKEMHLQNRKFTWSNARCRPMLVRLNHVFCNESWDTYYDDHVLHTVSSSHSDHYPLLLAQQSGPRCSTPFKFENFWTCLPGFHDVVKQAWSKPTSHTKPFHRLGHKLHVTAQAL